MNTSPSAQQQREAFLVAVLAKINKKPSQPVAEQQKKKEQDGRTKHS